MADGLTPPRAPVIEGAAVVEPEVAIRIRDAQSREFTVEDIRTPDTRHLKHGKFRVTLSLDGQALFRLDGFDDPDDALRKAKMIVKAIIGTVETREEQLVCWGTHEPCECTCQERRKDR